MQSKESLFTARLRLIGKVLAICTHEIRNHLAIIRENTGLIVDTLQLARHQDIDAFKPLKCIDNQALRSTALLSVMSSFCHRLDTEISEFSLIEITDELLTLLQRYINQQEIELTKDYSKYSKSLKSNPSIIQFVLFCLFQRLQSKSSALLAIYTEATASVIQLKSKELFKSTTTEDICSLQLITQACEILGAEIHIDSNIAVLKIPNQ